MAFPREVTALPFNQLPGDGHSHYFWIRNAIAVALHTQFNLTVPRVSGTPVSSSPFRRWVCHQVPAAAGMAYRTFSGFQATRVYRLTVL